MKQLTFGAMAAKRFTVVECVRAHVKFSPFIQLMRYFYILLQNLWLFFEKILLWTKMKS